MYDNLHMKVIIDNMMNLEVLFVAEALTGNRTYRDIAISHADKTMQNHIRADGQLPYSFSQFCCLFDILST